MRWQQFEALVAGQRAHAGARLRAGALLPGLRATRRYGKQAVAWALGAGRRPAADGARLRLVPGPADARRSGGT